jgi:hypothetical protein
MTDREREAIREADRALQALWCAIYSHATGSGAQRIDGSELYLLVEINRARSAIAGSVSGESQSVPDREDGGPWTDHVSTSALSGTGWMP